MAVMISRFLLQSHFLRLRTVVDEMHDNFDPVWKVSGWCKELIVRAFAAYISDLFACILFRTSERKLPALMFASQDLNSWLLQASTHSLQAGSAYHVIAS